MTVSQHRRVYEHISAVRSLVTVNSIHTHKPQAWYQISGSHSYDIQSHFQCVSMETIWLVLCRNTAEEPVDQSGVGRLELLWIDIMLFSQMISVRHLVFSLVRLSQDQTTANTTTSFSASVPLWTETESWTVMSHRSDVALSLLGRLDRPYLNYLFFFNQMFLMLS